ncbi:hypothetical protein CYMTET_39175, partial [Cymbomonas tetramitiformis]
MLRTFQPNEDTPPGLEDPEADNDMFVREPEPPKTTEVDERAVPCSSYDDAEGRCSLPHPKSRPVTLSVPRLRPQNSHGAARRCNPGKSDVAGLQPPGPSPENPRKLTTQRFEKPGHRRSRMRSNDSLPPRRMEQRLPDIQKSLLPELNEHSLTSKGIQVSPSPWTRYYLPQGCSEGGRSPNVFFQHFDVCLPDPLLSPRHLPNLELVDPLPRHLQLIWNKLFFVSLPHRPSQQGEMCGDVPRLHIYESRNAVGDILRGELLEPEMRVQRVGLARLCTILTQLQPRSEDDLRPLSELRRAMLQHVAGELEVCADRVRQRLLSMEHNCNAKMAAMSAALQEETEALMGQLDSEKRDNFMRALHHKLHLGKLAANDPRTQLEEKLAAAEAKTAEMEARVIQVEAAVAEAKVEAAEAQAQVVAQTARAEAAAAKNEEVLRAEAEDRLSELDTKLAAALEAGRRIADREAAKEAELDTLRPLAQLGMQVDAFFEEMCESREELKQRKLAFSQRLEEGRQHHADAQRREGEAKELAARNAAAAADAASAVRTEAETAEALRVQLNNVESKFFAERRVTVGLQHELHNARKELEGAAAAAVEEARLAARRRASEARARSEALRHAAELEWELFSKSGVTADQEAMAAEMRSQLDQLSAELTGAEQGLEAVMVQRDAKSQQAALDQARHQAEAMQAELAASLAADGASAQAAQQEQFLGLLMGQIEALEARVGTQIDLAPRPPTAPPGDPELRPPSRAGTLREQGIAGSLKQATASPGEPAESVQATDGMEEDANEPESLAVLLTPKEIKELKATVAKLEWRNGELNDKANRWEEYALRVAQVLGVSQAQMLAVVHNSASSDAL